MQKSSFTLPVWLYLLPLVNLVLSLVIILTTLPAPRLLAISLLLGSLFYMILLRYYLGRQIENQLRSQIDTQIELTTTKQHHLLAVALHDTVTQQVYATSLIAASLSSESVAEQLAQLRVLTANTHVAVRHLLLNLRPGGIGDRPLDKLISELIQIKQAGTSIPISYHPVGSESYQPDVHYSLYQIVDLALSNAIFHSDASAITIDVRLTAREARLSIEDNGKGFDPNAAAISPGHFGLQNMHIHALSIKAALTFDTLPGPDIKRITCIWRKLPC